ncbi:MAG: carbohydrate-binding domain-containing protein [Oscillospiraceae bacterium]|nr:carbohydrate-binding domain-containing protein [Oscillospiraceae bacterium]
MKQKLQKSVAMLLSGGILCASFLLPAAAADDNTDPPAETMTAVITLNGDSASAEGENVTIDGCTITITASGSYELSGTLNDGQVIVNVPDEKADPDTVKLFFNGVTMTGVTDAPLLIENAENTSLNLVAGTENFLYDGKTYTDTTAVVYAKDDITFKGDGKLRIEAAYQQGVHCNNDVKITGGNIKVKTEVGDAIRGKTSVTVKDGILDINSGGDGIKSTKGSVLISGGSIEIKASNDAVQGETSLQITGGSLKANGDRSLTNANGTVCISGGTVLATATEQQIAVVDAAQNTVMFHVTAQQVKDQLISLKDSDGNTAFEMNPDKKFDYVLISSPELKTGSDYKLYIGEKESAGFTLGETLTELEPVTVPADTAAINYDIDGNGAENITDAVMVVRIIGEDAPPDADGNMLMRSDLNADGFTNVEDASLILKYLAAPKQA